MTEPTLPRPPMGTPQATPAAATAQRAGTITSSRRMTPVNRARATEYLDVPIYYARPLGDSGADAPIVKTYAQLVWRADELPPFVTDSDEA